MDHFETISSDEDIDSPEIKKEKENIKENMGEYLCSKKFSDVKILVDGNEIHAHKIVLAASGSYFEDMFSDYSKEKDQAIITIPDIEFDVFLSLLAYIYTGKVLIRSKLNINLLAAANKFHIEELKRECEKYLKSKLNIQNAVDTLIAAYIHNAADLEKATQAYVIENFAEVELTEQYERFKNHKNAGHIFARMFEMLLEKKGLLPAKRRKY